MIYNSVQLCDSVMWLIIGIDNGIKVIQLIQSMNVNTIEQLNDWIKMIWSELHIQHLQSWEWIKTIQLSYSIIILSPSLITSVYLDLNWELLISGYWYGC